MGCCQSHTPGDGSGEPMGEAVDLAQEEKLKNALQAISSLQAAVADLTKTTGQLQRENESLKLQMTSVRSGLGATPSSTGAGSNDPGILPGGWAPVEGSSTPLRERGGSMRRNDSKLAGAGGGTGSDSAAIARLEAQVMDLNQRLKSAEGLLEQVKETWEAQRAAQEFQKQLRKLESQGILPMHGGYPKGPSGPPSSMSFAEELPPLDGLPQNRYPRAPGAAPKAGTRRANGSSSIQNGGSYAQPDRTSSGMGGAGGMKPSRRAAAAVAGNMPSPVLEEPAASSGPGAFGNRGLSPMRAAGLSPPAAVGSGALGGGGGLGDNTFKDLGKPSSRGVPGTISNSGVMGGAGGGLGGGIGVGGSGGWGTSSGDPADRSSPVGPGGMGGVNGGGGGGGAMMQELNLTKLYGNISPSDHALAHAMRRNGTGGLSSSNGPKQAF